MTNMLLEQTPPEIGGERVDQVDSLDGVKLVLADDSWLLVRPSGTEPVLRVYAEGRSPEMVRALIGFGEQVARQTA
jgi:phosphomannomutase